MPAISVLTDVDSLRAVLRSGPSLDSYVAALTKADIVARNLVDRNSMYDRIYNNIVLSPSGDLMRRLQSAIDHCERELLRDTCLSGQLHSAHFCLTHDRLEDGMPFTLENVVFLPSTLLLSAAFDRLCDTLLHEVTHVFQRMQPKPTGMLVRGTWGFQPLSDFEFQQLVLQGGARSARTNPDTVGQHYRLGHVAWLYEFASSAPTSLTDGKPVAVFLQSGQKMDTKYEHPFEMMAYMVPLLIRGMAYEGPSIYSKLYDQLGTFLRASVK